MADAPDVLFVVLDSVRAGRVSAYGHDRETTPALDDLASGATTYGDAHTPTPWTLPSHCSMFTGLWPSEHGVTNGFADAGLRLPDGAPTLAERLAEQGYRTAGFSNNPWVGALSGLDRGFEEYVEWDLEIGRRGDADIHTARDDLLSRGHTLLGQAARTPLYLLKRRFFTGRLVERARRWLATVREPAFTFLNLMEAHSPYYPPGWAFEELGLDPPRPLEARRLNVRLTAHVLGKGSLGDRRERVLEYYDASLRYQDRQFGRLLAALRERDRLEDALVVVCSDHGKTVGDYDRDASPPHYLRDVNTKVPLVVKAPGQRTGRWVDDPVELRGLFDLMVTRPRDGDGLATPADGAALVEDFLPHTSGAAEPVTRWRALVDGDGKYLRSEDGTEFLLDRGDGGVREPADAAVASYRDRLAGRVDALAETESVHERGADDEMDRTVRAQLEDLGYME